MNTRKTGSEYERAAAGYLEERGYRILETNYRCSAGEIDVVAEQDTCLCFIEVKYRSSIKAGYPQEAVNRKKQRRIYRSAACYLGQRGYPPQTRCRFDVVGICPPDIWLIQNAFGGI